MASIAKRIVYVHQDGLVTGSAISLRNMISILDKRIYKPIVLIPKKGDAIALWEAAGAEVHIFPFTTFWTSTGPRCLSRENFNQQKALCSNTQLRNFILSLNPDLVHINDKAALQAGVSLQNTNIPIVQHSRSAYVITACKWNKWISPRVIAKYASHIICISEDEIQGFENLSNKSILYNTVDMDAAENASNNRLNIRNKLGIPEQTVVIGMAEHLTQHKGSLELLTLLDELFVSKKLSDVRILLVGEQSDNDSILFKNLVGSTQSVLRQFIEQHDLKNYVLTTGYQQNVLEYIAAMDILIVAKSHGVLGRQPIEAQSVGTTVVALNGQSGKSKIIDHGKTGFLVSSVQEMISQVKKLIQHRDELDRCKQNARVYAYQNFNITFYQEKLSVIYNSLMHA